MKDYNETERENIARKIFEKEYKIKLVEPENNKEAVITHFLHNNKMEFHNSTKKML